MTDRYSFAKAEFERIRDKPYRVSTKHGEPADNCYNKTMELHAALGRLGYAVRVRIAEIDWADVDILPPELHALRDLNVVETHFFLEIDYEGHGGWKILDPSWNRPFAERWNLPWSEFGADNVSCFTIRRLYDFQEQASYVDTWQNSSGADYMQRMGGFLENVNAWLSGTNPVTAITLPQPVEPRP